MSGAHYNNISSVGYPASYLTLKAVCTNCHVNNTLNATVRKQWAKSGHAAFTDTAWIAQDFKTKTGCVQCHTATGFIAYSSGKITSAWGIDSDKTKEVLACNACHSDVANGVVRTVTPVSPFANDSYVNRNVGPSNICMNCHSGTNNGLSITSGNFASEAFISPHYLAAGGILHGKGGYNFPGRNYAFYSSNSHRAIGIGNNLSAGTDGPCIGCHMSASQKHRFKAVSSATGGVISQVTSGTCANCHGTSLNDTILLNDRKASFKNALDVLNKTLAYRGFTYSPTFSNFSSTNWGSDLTGANTMGAAFNYVLLMKEPGAYVHNMAYAKQLAFDSIDYLYNGMITNSIDSAVTSLVNHGITQAQANNLIAYKSSKSCKLCHANLSGAHAVHVGSLADNVSAYGYDGNFYNKSCSDCHPLDTSLHCNGEVNIELYNPEASRYKKFNPANAGRTGTGNATICSNIYCHSNAQDPITYSYTPKWGGSFNSPRVTPSITTLPSAGGIIYGHALSTSTLLGGAGSVPGAFAFTYPAAIPSAVGNYSAAITFTPTDTANYTTASGTIIVAVGNIYYFQNVAASTVCTGISTINQSGEANVLPGGPPVDFTVVWQRIWSYGTPGRYHFGWNASDTYSGSYPLSGISAQDMYTVPYTSPTTITGLSLRLNYSSVYGESGASTIYKAQLYAKFYDVDGNAPCTEGTLIAQTAQQLYIPNTVAATLTAPVSGLSYNIQPGHRIRVELWHYEYSDGFFGFSVNIKYGAGATTGLTVDQIPTLPDTCTVGPGTVLADTTILPGGPETALDSFTLQTSTGSDAIKFVRVSLSPPGSSSLIGSVSIKSDDGGTLYGAITNPVSEQLIIPLSAALTATTTPVQYKIMVTPKTAATMPYPVGASYAVKGYVSQLDSSYTKVYNDIPSATVTIDNITTDMPAWGRITPSDGSMSLNWTNPATGNFQSVLILRGTSPITATPAYPQIYAVGSALGASTVVYSGNLQTFTDGLVTGDALFNGTSYYYRIFARNSNGAYTTGSMAGPFTPMQGGPGTAIIGNGIDPPNDVATYDFFVNLDAFTLTSSPNAHLNSVAFSLTPGSAPFIKTLQLVDGSNGTIYKTIDNPASDTVVFSDLNNAITNSESFFMVRINASSSNRPPAGTVMPVTGRVTGITLDNANITISNTDTTSATLNIDHFPPANPDLLGIIPSDGCVRLNWAIPADNDLSNILILRNTSPITDVPQDGATYFPAGTFGTSTIVYSSHATIYGPVVNGYVVLENGSMSYGNLLLLLAEETTFYNCGLVNGTPYYYKIFARDLSRNYSPGVAAGPVTPWR